MHPQGVDLGLGALPQRGTRCLVAPHVGVGGDCPVHLEVVGQEAWGHSEHRGDAYGCLLVWLAQVVLIARHGGLGDVQPASKVSLRHTGHSPENQDDIANTNAHDPASCVLRRLGRNSGQVEQRSCRALHGTQGHGSHGLVSSLQLGHPLRGLLVGAVGDHSGAELAQIGVPAVSQGQVVDLEAVKGFGAVSPERHGLLGRVWAHAVALAVALDAEDVARVDGELSVGLPIEEGDALDVVELGSEVAQDAVVDPDGTAAFGRVGHPVGVLPAVAVVVFAGSIDRARQALEQVVTEVGQDLVSAGQREGFHAR